MDGHTQGSKLATATRTQEEGGRRKGGGGRREDGGPFAQHSCVAQRWSQCTINGSIDVPQQHGALARNGEGAGTGSVQERSNDT